MKKETDSGTRRGVPVANAFRHRQNRFLTNQRLAQDIGEEAGSSRIRLAGTNADGRQANADAVEETATAIVGEQQLADRFLRAIAGQRRGVELIRDRIGERRTEDGDRRGEDHSRLVTVLAVGNADGVEEITRAIEIDAVALVEIKFGFTGYDGSKMKDHIGAGFD